MKRLKELCRDYLNNRLSPEEQKWVEERISKGDETIISILRELQSGHTNFFSGDENSGSPRDENFPEEDSENLSDKVLSDGGSRNKFIRLIALAGLIIVFFTIYQQWQYYQTHQETEDLYAEVDQYQQQLQELEQELDESLADHSFLQQLLLSPESETWEHSFDDPRQGELFFTWNRETWNHALLANELQLGANEHISIWLEFGDSWNLLDEISANDEPVLLSDWSHSQLQQSNSIEFRIQTPDNEHIREDGELIENISLGE